MAFRKSYGTRKYTPRKRSTAVYKKVAKPTRQAIPALARKVTQLSKAITPLKRNIIHYNKALDLGIGNATGDNVFTVPLMNYSTWTRQFGADADDESGKSALVKRNYVSWEINTNGERNSLDYSIFVVSLKKNATDLLNLTTGDITGLTLNQHFVRGQNQGQGIFLNPNFFNIHYYKRWISGTIGSLSTDTPDLRKIFSWSMKKPVTVTNPRGDWKANNFPREVSKNYYLMIFNNDSTVDSAARCYFNQYIQVMTV